MIKFSSHAYIPNEVLVEWKSSVNSILDSRFYIGGEAVLDFEKRWASITDAKHAVGVGNGYDGLFLALKGLGLGPGKHVALPAHTFIATWNAVINVGAIPVGIDVDKNGLIDISKLEKVADKLDAVIPVHMHGAVVDVARIREVFSRKVRNKNFVIIEDASQAHLAASVGVNSSATVYSLYPTKNLGAVGDAGVVTTNDDELANTLRLLRNYGAYTDKKYNHIINGLNSRLDPIQASVLSVNLKYLSEWNERRKTIAAFYVAELEGKFEMLQPNLGENVRHHFCILSSKREKLIRFLRENLIETEIHYPLVAAVEAALFFGGQSKVFPQASRIADQTLSLPISQWHSDSQIEKVVSTLLRF